MADFPSWGIESPESAAQYGRGARLATIGKGIAGVATGAMGVVKYLSDEAKKKQLVSEIITKYPSATPYRDQLLEMDPKTLGEKTYILKVLDDRNKTIRGMYGPDTPLPDPFQHALSMPSVAELEKAEEKLYKPIEENLKTKKTAATTQKGLEALKGLPAKATQAERAGIFAETTGGEEPGKTAELAITGGEKPISPWAGLNYGANQEDKAIQQIQAAINSLKDVKTKKRDIWADVEAEKLKINSDRRKTQTEKMNEINTLVAKGHEADESAEKEAKMNSVIIYKNIKEFPQLQAYVTEDVMSEYEKYLNLSAKKPKQHKGIAPKSGAANSATPSPAPDKFIVGKQYKDSKGNIATYRGNGVWE